MYVLGIETSCDETAAAVVSEEGILSDVIWSQQIHAEYGGVVPEIASREHMEKVLTCTSKALLDAGIEKPDAVVATSGPGLKGAVLVGLCFAKSLSIGWNIPFRGVNHLEGHLLSARLDHPELEFPFLSVVVSGGHTTIYLAKQIGSYEVLSQTIDDAAGEAYDKVARMMGLGYPGGPIIDHLAQQGTDILGFPRPKPPSKTGKSKVGEEQRGDLDMSFSGLKTAVRQYLETHPEWEAVTVAASFQQAVIDVLVHRIKRAIQMTGVTSVAIGGGVAANQGLRERLLQEKKWKVYLPPKRRCTDNAAMIAYCGFENLKAFGSSSMDITARARWTPGTE